MSCVRLLARRRRVELLPRPCAASQLSVASSLLSQLFSSRLLLRPPPSLPIVTTFSCDLNECCPSVGVIDREWTAEKEVESDVLNSGDVLRFLELRLNHTRELLTTSSVINDEEQLDAYGKATFSQCQQIERAVMQSLRRKMELDGRRRTQVFHASGEATG